MPCCLNRPPRWNSSCRRCTSTRCWRRRIEREVNGRKRSRSTVFPRYDTFGSDWLCGGSLSELYLHSTRSSQTPVDVVRCEYAIDYLIRGFVFGLSQRNFSVMFSRLGPDIMLRLFAHLLFERRILFVSSKLFHLTGSSLDVRNETFLTTSSI